MKKKILLISFLFSVNIIPLSVADKTRQVSPGTCTDKTHNFHADLDSVEIFEYKIRSVYDSVKLSGIIDYSVFRKAYIGYSNMFSRLDNMNILTVIDYSLPSSVKRMAVIDILNRKLLWHTYVAHGRKTGGMYAESFSNEAGSGKSSIGFFITAETYTGRYGYSLRLDGLEHTNSNSRSRAIVLHGAEYVNADYISENGMPDGSGGCPAVSSLESRKIIDIVKGGSCLFIYYPDTAYMDLSPYLDAGKAVRRFHKDSRRGPR